MARQNNNRDECNEFAERVQNLAALKLYSLGYKVRQNSVNDGSNDYDILAQRPDGPAIKVEVKGARLHNAGEKSNGHDRGLRWQARVHNFQADVLVMYCETMPPANGGLEGAGVWFVIPLSEISPRKSVAIWSPNPAETEGQWARYLDAWEVLE